MVEGGILCRNLKLKNLRMDIGETEGNENLSDGIKPSGHGTLAFSSTITVGLLERR